MIRNLLALVVILFVYYVLKTVLRSAIRAYHDDGSAVQRPEGKEMVLDPECRTYIVKERAVARRLNGKPYYFCSEACAQRYQEQHRG